MEVTGAEEINSYIRKLFSSNSNNITWKAIVLTAMVAATIVATQGVVVGVALITHISNMQNLYIIRNNNNVICNKEVSTNIKYFDTLPYGQPLKLTFTAFTIGTSLKRNTNSF